MQNKSELSKAQWYGFFIVAFLVLFAGFGLRDPWPADEPRFVLVAKQMVESGQWLFPHRGIELYPDKPPVFFWLLSACFSVIGSWRWSFLLPSLLASMATLYLTFDLGKRLWSPRTGWWAAIAVLVSLQFVYQGKRAQIDPVLLVMTTLSFYAIARHVLLGPQWRWLYVGFFMAGLGVITKGVGFLPLLSLLPLALFRRYTFAPLYTSQSKEIVRWATAFGCFLLAISLWLVPLLIVTNTSNVPEQHQYLQNILFKQTAGRYANPWHHYEPFWYYFEVIALFWLPFSLAWFWLIKPWREAFTQRNLAVIFPLCWALLVVVFFSISSGKRDMYILPALPAFALAAAPYLQSISEKTNFRRALFCFVLLLAILLFSVGAAAHFGNAQFASRLLAERGLGSEAVVLWWMLMALGAGMLVLLGALRIKKVLYACALSLFALWLCYGFIVYSILDDSSSAKALMQNARAVAGAKTEIGMVAWKEQNLLQAVGPVVEFGFLQGNEIQLERAVRWLNKKPQQRVLLLNEQAKNTCIDFKSEHAIALEKANRRSWWLLKAGALRQCTGKINADKLGE